MSVTSTDALFLIDKPGGTTSFTVVRALGRAIGTRRVGHTGTLDPFATGLLLVLAGQGTRLARHVRDEPKVYLATIAFGTETATDDPTGEVIRRAELPEPGRVERAVAELTGRLSQVPPAFSAKKIRGERAYALARRGANIDLPASIVNVTSWDLLGWESGGAGLQVRITCGRGTYVRALARDLGRLSGSAAHCAALRRERSGSFHVADATTLDEVQDGRLSPRPLLEALGDMHSVVLSTGDAERASHGMRIPATGTADRAALLYPDGRLLGLGRRVQDSWHPELVLAYV